MLPVRGTHCQPGVLHRARGQGPGTQGLPDSPHTPLVPAGSRDTPGEHLVHPFGSSVRDADCATVRASSSSFEGHMLIWCGQCSPPFLPLSGYAFQICRHITMMHGMLRCNSIVTMVGQCCFECHRTHLRTGSSQ